MASGEDPCPEHPKPTRHSSFRYCFYFAHHHRRVPDKTQWADDLGRDEEFAIFDEADQHELSDLQGKLYGLRRSPEGVILDLGTGGEQIAKFWNPNENKHQPTHGFPMWPLADDAPENRRQTPSPKEAILRMEAAGLLLPEQRKKLLKGRSRHDEHAIDSNRSLEIRGDDPIQ